MSFFSYFYIGDIMKKIVFFLVLLILPFQVSAYSTSASCGILMDQDSGRILYSNNIHKVRSVASISKIMTGILAIESGKLDSMVTIDDVILKAYGSAIYLQVGEEISLRNLVYGLMLRSGNDAALAIAKFVSGSVDEFVLLMNKKAKEIGMKNTTFNNPSGLDQEKGNYSTAYDMAILTSYAMKNDTYSKIVGTKKHTVKTNKNNYLWKNKNKLLYNYSYTTGGKTGFTEIAKRTLVSTASKDNLNLVVVTLNDGNDFLDHKSLYEEAFSSLKSYELLKKGPIEILNENYYEGYDFIIKDSFSYPMYDEEKDSVLLSFRLEKKREYKKNDKVGVVNVFLGDKKIYETGIYLKEKVVKKSWLSKLGDWFS